MATLYYIGRPQGSAVTDTGTLGEDEMRASTFYKISKNVWLRSIGARIGSYSGGTKDYRLVAYIAGSDNVPTSRRAMTSLHSIATIMTSATEGAYVEWLIDTADDSPTVLAAPVFSGTYVALAIEHDTAGLLGHGMVERADPAFPSGQDDQFRTKTGVATPPTSFGAFTPSTEGVMSIYAVCHENIKPHVPVNRDEVNLNLLTPTFEGDFRDDNGNWGGADDCGDYMQNYRIQVRRVSDSVMFWNPGSFSASAGERSANQFSRTYAGTTLVRGTAYEWRCLVEDYMGAISDWSDWKTFTISAGGTVTAGPTPSGKQDTVTPGPFTGKWTHATALAMTHAQVAIKYNGVNIRVSGDINIADVASSAPPGTSFSVTWAQTGFADLTSGNYTYEIVGKDSAGNYSAWSNKVAFSVDKSPSTPTSLQPYGQVKTDYPIITLVASDEDDTPGTGLIVKVEIMNAAGTILQTRTMTSVGGSNWQYQTVSADVPSFGTYRYQAYSFDGFLYSGGTTVEASAQRSYEGSFVYADGPDLAITAPTEGGSVTTRTPTITWTAPTQTQWRIKVWDINGNEVYATNGGNWTATSQQSYQIKPVAYLGNHDTYRLDLEVADSLGLTATASVSFTVDMPPPADVTGFQVTPTLVFTDPWPTAIRGDWEMSAELNFAAYNVYRSDVTAITGEPLFRLTSVYDTAFLDFHPASGIDYTYTVTVITEDEFGDYQSDGVTAEGRVDLQGVVISSVLDPQTTRTALASIQERTHDRFGTETTYKRWGDTAPSTVRGRGRWWEVTIVALLHDNADAVLSALERLAEIKRLDGIDHTFCVRDERGNKWFMKIPADGGLSISDQRLGRSLVTIRGREEAFHEGLEVTV